MRGERSTRHPAWQEIFGRTGFSEKSGDYMSEMLKIASSVTPPVQARNTLSIFESSIFIPYQTGKNQRCYRLFFGGLVVKSAMRKIIRKGILLIACLIGISGLAEAGEAVKLFDGKTFAGWEGNELSFRIEQGAVVGGSLKARIPRNEFLCTKKNYKNFILTLEVKLLGGPKANAGIQIRTKRIPNHHEVSGYQADMGVGWWGSLYDESRRNKVLARADAAVIQKTLKPDGWNRYKIHCEGRRIRLYINGTLTVDYTEPDPKIPLVGVIALQIHGGSPSEAWYREITITELP